MIAPNKKNYSRPSGHLLFEPDTTTGWQHLGNIPELTVGVEFEVDEHKESMSGQMALDDEDILEKKVTLKATLEEITPQNYAWAWLADAPGSSQQTAGAYEDEEITTVADKYVEINGKRDLTYLKIEHSTPAGGTFDRGTAHKSGGGGISATIIWADTTNNVLYCVALAGGTFAVGDTVQDAATTPTVTATVEKVSNPLGIILTDDGTTPTEMFVEGTDYDIISQAGLIRELTGGGITANTAYLSADYPLETLYSVGALKNTETRGRLLYVGTNTKGPRYKHLFHDVSIKLSGDQKVVSANERTNMPLEIKVFIDTTKVSGEQWYTTEIKDNI